MTLKDINNKKKKITLKVSIKSHSNKDKKIEGQVVRKCKK